MRYAIVIEKAENNYSAYVPDLPGCVATGATVADVERDFGMRSASTSTASRPMACRFPRRRASRIMWRRERDERLGIPGFRFAHPGYAR